MSSSNNWLQRWDSPLEERHIDFLLEEEFLVNPDFLPFFADLAWKRSKLPDECALNAIPTPPECYRSVTSLAGESDVLVIYANRHDERVAILIEDKIGASFQKDQPQRYRKRGDQGIEQGRWQHYWTCLVAPSSYSKSNNDFDARVNLEELASFFDHDKDNARSRFKAGVLRNSANKPSIPGVKNPDAAMAEFRRQYSVLANQILHAGNWRAEEKEKCFTGDSWFQYFHPSLGKTLKCVHKPLMGVVQLIFPSDAMETLKRLVGVSEQNKLNIGYVGKTGVAVEVPVRRLNGVNAFSSTAEVNALVVEATSALAVFNEFILQNQNELKPYGLLVEGVTTMPERNPDEVVMKALEAQLFGLIWARAIEFNSPAGFEYPDLSDLFHGRIESKFINIPGMAGGFNIIVRRTPHGNPVIFTESESRIWAGGMLNEIHFGEIHSEPDSVYGGPTLEEWAEQRMSLRRTD